MKFLPLFLSLLSVALCRQIFTGSDGKSVMYSISDVALTWIDAVKVQVSLVMCNKYVSKNCFAENKFAFDNCTCKLNDMIYKKANSQLHARELPIKDEDCQHFKY